MINYVKSKIKRWETSLSNEWGRLVQGNRNNSTPTDTIDFIHRSEVPSNKAVTYVNSIIDYRPLKKETHRIIMKVGSYHLSYPGLDLQRIDQTETQLLINSVISDAS